MNMKELAFTTDLSLAARGMYLVLRKNRRVGVGGTFNLSYLGALPGLSKITSQDISDALAELTEAKVLIAMENDGPNPQDKYNTIYKINR